MRMPRSLVLIVLTARASVSPLCARASLSFQRAIPPLAPSRFLPPRDLWGKNSGAEVLSARLRASSRRLRFRVPRFRHTERCLPSLCKRERSGLVRGKWRWAGRWQHVTGSLRCWGAVGLSDWSRPLRFARAQRRQSRDGCRTFPCPLQSGWRAGFGVVSTRGALSQPSGWVVSAGAPSGPSTTTIVVLPWSSRRAHEILALPLLCPPPYFRFICPHYGWRRWRKGIWEDASTGWVSGCTSLPTHCHRLEGESQSPVQAMQDHFSARWTLLRFSWIGGFGAPLYGGSSGLSGQAPLCRRRVWAWSCDSQGAEKRNGPSFASHQDHRPSHRKVYGQPGSARAPPVAHADGDQGRGQGLLPWCSNFPQRPLWTCGERIRWVLHRSTEGVTGYATLPAQALQPSSCLES